MVVGLLVSAGVRWCPLALRQTGRQADRQALLQKLAVGDGIYAARARQLLNEPAADTNRASVSPQDVPGLAR